MVLRASIVLRQNDRIGISRLDRLSKFFPENMIKFRAMSCLVFDRYAEAQ